MNDTHAHTSPLTSPPATALDRATADVARRCLTEALGNARNATMTVRAHRGESPHFNVPIAALHLLARILQAMAEGRAMYLELLSQELGVDQAARLLGVTRAFLERELDAGRLAFHANSGVRVIALTDLQQFRTTLRAQQQAALETMADDARQLGLDY